MPVDLIFSRPPIEFKSAAMSYRLRTIANHFVFDKSHRYLGADHSKSVLNSLEIELIDTT